MTKFSSFKKQQKLFENWRRFNEACTEEDEEAAEYGDAAEEIPNPVDQKTVTAHYQDDEDNLEGMVDEDLGNTKAIENLLSQISKKLDSLEDIDGSIDYLSSLMSDENPLLTKIKQDTYGRYAKPGKIAIDQAAPAPVATESKKKK